MDDVPGISVLLLGPGTRATHRACLPSCAAVSGMLWWSIIFWNGWSTTSAGCC